MKVAGRAMRTIWREGACLFIIDQTQLPHRFATKELARAADVAHAIRAMEVRGAPLIGAAAAYGMALAVAEDSRDAAIEAAAALLLATRPTAVNLRWALDDMRGTLLPLAKKGRGPVEILTHCNAGWLAAVDWGTALAPIYLAHERGIPLHVWVDETRPRNQGASLTAWELGEHGVPHTVIVDNAGGHLMQRGRVDLAIVGSDRTTAAGDVANKIGTYLKALAAFDNGVPFYVALPSSTIDWTIEDGSLIPIEERDAGEVSEIAGATAGGGIARVRLTPAGSPAANYGFDVTPARLVTALITERGVAPASREGLLALFPERRSRLAGE
jgi:methylthioribose-1-phosphate isomerase